jgi:hypothetical protein
MRYLLHGSTTCGSLMAVRLCLAGMHIVQTIAHPSDCAIGQIRSPPPAIVGCSPCPIGTYKDYAGLDPLEWWSTEYPYYCYQCPVAKSLTVTTGSTSRNDCTCGAGKYAVDSESCQTCLAGTSSTLGQDVCSVCQFGSVSTSGGACTECPTNQFAFLGSQCVEQCPGGYYFFKYTVLLPPFEGTI